MCARVLYLLVAAVVIQITATAAAFAYLPWWQAIAVAAGTAAGQLLIGKWLVRRLVGRLQAMAAAAFDGPSRALRGATADVHHVARLAAPDPDTATYRVDLSVYPADLAAAWNPHDLILVPPDADISPQTWATAARTVECRPTEVRAYEDGAFAAAGRQVRGSQRLQLTVSVPRDWRAAKLRYYFEAFGRIDLPDRFAAVPAG